MLGDRRGRLRRDVLRLSHADGGTGGTARIEGCAPRAGAGHPPRHGDAGDGDRVRTGARCATRLLLARPRSGGCGEDLHVHVERRSPLHRRPLPGLRARLLRMRIQRSRLQVRIRDRRGACRPGSRRQDVATRRIPLAWTFSMTGLTAIDVLIEPDARLVQPANAFNTRLHAANPDGFVFDATHAPHITLVHRYVETRDLESLFDAVKRMVSARGPIGVELVATGLSYTKIGDIGIMSLDVAHTTALDELHAAVLELVAPFSRTGGTPTAFFRTTGEPDVMLPTVQYVHDFVP